MSEYEVKIVVDTLTGRLFAELSDGSLKTITVDANGGLYVEVDE